MPASLKNTPPANPTATAPAPTQRRLTNRDITDLVNNKQYDIAEPVLLKVIEAYPDNVWALTALGIVYRATAKPYAAETCYTRALEIEPNNPEVCSNYGNLLVDLDRMEEALNFTERAVKMDPNAIVFRKNLAVAQRESKQFEKALKNYQWCLAKEPDDANLLYDIAYVQFYLRDLDNAWEYAEHRFKTNKISLPDVGNTPAWQGESLKGKKLLVMAEQGFGDTILMTRFLPVLNGMGAEVTFSCKEPLHDVFQKLPVKLIGLDIAGKGPFDYYVTMMSIPRLVEKDWLKWPASPEFFIPEKSREKFAKIANHKPDRLKVGIVWSGSVTFAKNEKRAVELDQFLRLAAQLPNVQFYSFQKGPREADMKKHGFGTMLPLGHMFDNFSETAAALEHMDCIVMTDSSVCHLAGSLSVPVINLLQFMPYWLYFPESSKTPLYSSVRFIRQHACGAWDKVFDRTEKVLKTLATERQKRKLDRADVLKLIDAQLSKK